MPVFGGPAFCRMIAQAAQKGPIAPYLPDTGNEVDLQAWLCTIPGVPADWGQTADLQPATVVPQHIGVVPIGDGLAAKS